MDNLHLLTTRFKSLRDCDGPVTGLYYTEDQYFIILRGELTRIQGEVREELPTTRGRVLFPGLTYSTHEDRIFFGDGECFYYQSLIVDDMIKVNAPFPFLACAYSCAQDKVAVLGVHGQVVICDVSTRYNQIVQVHQWAMSDPVPPLQNLNWGTAENQFAGFDNTTVVDAIRNAAGLICTEHANEIVWRPDGKFFLISYTEFGKRRFKIFDINTGIFAQNEDIPGLQAPIAWRATQSMITVSCCSDDVWRLVIFENKGFAKDVINLEDWIPIVRLAWDATGTVLAVHQKGQAESFVLLFTVSNFTFEQKQKVVFSMEEPVSYLVWQRAPRYRFDLIVATSKKMLHYSFAKRPTKSAISLNGGSIVASINGNKLMILDFERFILPPPYKSLNYGQQMLYLPNAVNRVIFNASRKTFLVVDCRNLCYVFNNEREPRLMSKETGITLPMLEDYPLSIHHYMFYDNVIAAIGVVNSMDMMLRYDFANDEIIWRAMTRPYICGVLYVKNRFYNKEYTYSYKGEYYVNGELVSVIPNGIRSMESIMNAPNHEHVFILDNGNALYCNEKLISRDVVSFIVFNHYFMFTTTDNTLYSCRLNILDTILASNLPRDDRKLRFDKRVLEEGAKLVTGVTRKLTAVVQLPRGNLELISTDLLGIDRVNYLLDCQDWQKAINEARLHLLNPNVLVDTNIERFLRNVRIVIALMNAQMIIDFLLTLTEGNVLSTLSCSYQYVINVNEDKILRVCKKFIEEMEAASTGTYMEAIMVARVKAYGLENAVTFAKSVYDVSNLDVNKTVQRGLEAIARYWNADEICTLCLKTYDLDFCLFAYYFFKKDPQLTAMIIDNFRASTSMDELRYKVNHFVGDHKTATMYYTLHVLSRGSNQNGQFELTPLIQYAQTYDQLEVVYNILCKAKICIAEISKVYGEYLLLTDKIKAAEVYMHAAHYEIAFTLYVSMFHWEEALVALHAMNLPRSEHNHRKRLLADHLTAAGKHKPAAQIFDDLGLPQHAVQCLTYGHFYKDAADLAVQRNLTNELEMVKEKLIDYGKLLMDLFVATEIEIANFNKRLEKIWNDRVEDMLVPAVSVSGDAHTAEYAESLRSGLSAASRSSRTSAKSARKEQRRYIDLREGGPYEDIAIMRAVHIKIEEISNMKSEVSTLLSTYLYFNLKQDAEELQKVYSRLQDSFEKSIERIWFPGLDSESGKVQLELAQNLNLRVQAARKNFEFMEEKYRDPPSLGSIEWKNPALK